MKGIFEDKIIDAEDLYLSGMIDQDEKEDSIFQYDSARLFAEFIGQDPSDQNILKIYLKIDEIDLTISEFEKGIKIIRAFNLKSEKKA
jgi:hypothetical protein